MERALGVQFLERGRFGALPTAFGLALVRHADAIDAELRSAVQEVMRCVWPAAGTSVLAADPRRPRGCCQLP